MERCFHDRARGIISTQDNLQKEVDHLARVLKQNAYPANFIRSASAPPTQKKGHTSNCDEEQKRGHSSSDNRTTVVRNGSVGFSFTNMVDFNIYSLAFTSCNRSWDPSSRPASNSALLLQSTANAKLVNCTFHDNLGNALTVRNTSITLAENNEFVRNQCRCQLFNKLGCGITALNSNLMFTGNTTFHKNIAVGFFFCGVIWASASLLNFTGTSNFIDNSVYSSKSCVIYVKEHTSLSFTGISDFSNNSAGVIYTSSNVVLTFNGISSFVNNTARFGHGRNSKS